MKKTSHIFNNISEIEPPAYLKEAILTRIKEARDEKIRSKKIMFRAGFVFSGILTVFSGLIFGKEFLASEFWSIASLIFTDVDILLAHWQSFVFSLLETFPTIAVVSMLVPIFFFMILVKKYAKQETFEHMNIQALKHVSI